MSSDFQPDNQFNPYQSNPATFDPQPLFNKAKVQAPAIALIVCGTLGLFASIYGAFNALVSQVPPIPPDAPELAVQSDGVRLPQRFTRRPNVSVL